MLNQYNFTTEPNKYKNQTNIRTKRMIVPKKGALYKHDDDYYIIIDLKKTKVEFSKVTVTDSNDESYYVVPSEDHETKTIKSFIKDFVLVY